MESPTELEASVGRSGFNLADDRRDRLAHAIEINPCQLQRIAAV
jgi:hypothetical protein